MDNIKLLFPVAIYTEDDLFDDRQNKFWAKKILKMSKDNKSFKKWQGNTNTSHGVFRLTEDKDFNNLFNSIKDRVKSFAEKFNSQATYDCDHAWFNINLKNTFQEFHYHSSSIFSGVYYVKVPKHSGGIVFDDPKNPDMFPLKNVTENNDINHTQYRFEAKKGRLIIFRSYLSHCVEAGNNKKPRISISFNYS